MIDWADLVQGKNELHTLDGPLNREPHPPETCKNNTKREELVMKALDDLVLYKESRIARLSKELEHLREASELAHAEESYAAEVRARREIDLPGDSSAEEAMDLPGDWNRLC